MLFNLLLLLLIVLHDLYPLGLHQATFLNVELLLCLCTEGEFNHSSLWPKPQA